MWKSLYTESIERRDKVQIFADIIRVSGKSAKVTRILRLANVQYNTFIEYVDRLCGIGFLERVSLEKSGVSGKRSPSYRYKATMMGEEWCGLVDEIYEDLEVSSD